MGLPDGLRERLEHVRPAVQGHVLDWAAGHLRDFPWRRPDRAPYQVLVAELLLKRTTATAAARVYENLVAKYPTPIHLVTAPEEELAQDLDRVGLHYQRAKAMAKLARHLVEWENGTVPDSLERLLNVPGLGVYSARAVLTFGYGIAVAVVDANVGRVLNRVLQESMPPKPTQSFLQEVADALLPEDAHRQFNFGLMDLGAIVCRYVRPDCRHCPLDVVCDFYRSGSIANLPASRLREVRRAKRVGLAELARKAGVSKLTIVNIEAGRTAPQERTLRKIADALGVHVENLALPRGGLKEQRGS